MEVTVKGSASRREGEPGSLVDMWLEVGSSEVGINEIWTDNEGGINGAGAAMIENLSSFKGVVEKDRGVFEEDLTRLQSRQLDAVGPSLGSSHAAVQVGFSVCPSPIAIDDSKLKEIRGISLRASNRHRPKKLSINGPKLPACDKK